MRCGPRLRKGCVGGFRSLQTALVCPVLQQGVCPKAGLLTRRTDHAFIRAIVALYLAEQWIKSVKRPSIRLKKFSLGVSRSRYF
jgi:hypothetical protein